MKIPLDKRVWPGFLILGILALVAFLILQPAAIFFTVLLLGHTAFFRDPRRSAAPGNAPLAPADGTVTDISSVFEDRFLKEDAVKIGIFLSIFSVHVNRSPMEGTVRYQEYVPGKFLNAMRKDASLHNQANWVGFENPSHRVLVRQITGAIARRIHSDVVLEQKVERGEKFGMICYGSRTEVYIPKRLFRPTIACGQPVKAGQTVLGQWLS